MEKGTAIKERDFVRVFDECIEDLTGRVERDMQSLRQEINEVRDDVKTYVIPLSQMNVELIKNLKRMEPLIEEVEKLKREVLEIKLSVGNGLEELKKSADYGSSMTKVILDYKNVFRSVEDKYRDLEKSVNKIEKTLRDMNDGRKQSEDTASLKKRMSGTEEKVDYLSSEISTIKMRLNKLIARSLH